MGGVGGGVRNFFSRLPHTHLNGIALSILRPLAAHSVVLASASPRLKYMLPHVRTPANTYEITLENQMVNTVQTTLTFMYTGEQGNLAYL